MNLSPYIGVPYLWRGVMPHAGDCWTLVRYVADKEFGYDLPEYLYDVDADAKALAATESALGARWERVETPEPGDVLMFRLGGFPAHCGIYVGEGQFLHSLKGRNSCLEHLALWGTRLVGVYRWKGGA